MKTVAPLLVATVCFSLCANTCPSAASYQASRKASETAEKLYEMMAKGDIEGTEKLIDR